MIRLRELAKQVRSGGQALTILHPLNLDIPKAQFAVVMGPSGSGKSTLLGLLAGLERPSTGSVEVLGHSLAEMNQNALARFRGEQIGFVFQSFHLLPTLTAQENVQAPLEIAAASLKEARSRAQELLEQVGLQDQAARYPKQLSGGEQQRVAIARAFARQPALLLADEPTGNLDRENSQSVLQLLQQLHRERGATVVLATHDLAICACAERVLKLENGRLVEDSQALNGLENGTQERARNPISSS